jgi:hypothetical protein
MSRTSKYIVIKHIFNPCLVKKEKEEYCKKIEDLCADYYVKLLQHMNGTEAFNNMVEKDRYPNLVLTNHERVLESTPSNHFGDAFKRIQSLFFMLREN